MTAAPSTGASGADLSPFGGEVKTEFWPSEKT